MKKDYSKYFCDCCGKKIERKEGIENFKAIFKAYWDDTSHVVTDHDDLKRSERWQNGYTNILPEDNAVYEKVSNHKIIKGSGSIEYIELNLNNVCKDCATELITRFKKIRDDFMDGGVLRNELEDDSLKGFTTEQLLEEIKKRTE